MSEIQVYVAPLEQDILPLSALLWRQQIPHRVVEEHGQQVIFITNSALHSQANSVCQHFEQLIEQGIELTVEKQPTIRGHSAANFFKGLIQTPLTSVIVVFTLLVAVITSMGEDLNLVRWFSFFDIHVVGEGRYIRQGSMAGFGEGQYWRILSPIFLHFGALHITFNMLWFWELGRRIERAQSFLPLLLLVIVVGVLSNTAQYIAGQELFGGMSGVLYGLLGYCWIWPKIDPKTQFQLPNGIVGFMLVWLVLCMTDFTEWLNLGSIANTAHVSGLILGCLFAFIGAAVRRSLGR